MSKKVMIVDDSKTARREIVRLVHNLGLMAFEAENGKYGLELIRNRTDIGLIFCDINMPEMNGLEFLEALRKEANHKETPVIMLTSEAAEDVLNKAKEFGIKGWILKPAQPNSVKSLLEKFCA
ncbi:MAG: response regulator [Pseudobdellovibrionaceae bacterium]|uniref:response regulator n=1 Tax=Oligoflexus sp. TaxID=1971216 RepID=UPI0027D12E9F|nr:response regulator [Oligoflexus sp.]MDQ3233691.1 response regulator [Pseudobdellovibrionaceae bacterium]HYX38167.1 response regulator [Oligoflexus sp.]